MDAVNAARQYQSLQLWMARDRFDLVVSDLVIDEASDGDPQAALRRLAFAGQLRRVAIPLSAAHIATALVASGALPKVAFADGLHIACASLLECDVIASWNFRHIASLWARQGIHDCLASLGARSPAIATPEEIIESL